MSPDHNDPGPSSLQGRLASLKRAQEARRRQQQPGAPSPEASRHGPQPGPDSKKKAPASTSSSPDVAPEPQPLRPEAPAEQTGLLSPDKIAERVRRSEERRQAEQAAAQLQSAAAELPPDPPWEDERTPPGSLYAWQEWQAAIDDGRGGRNIVFEIRNGGQGALITMPREKGRDALEATLLDGCLLLSPKATTTHPLAVCGQIELHHGALPRTYRVVRPEAHRQDRAFLFGAKGWLKFSSEAAGTSGGPDLEEDEAAAGHPRPRG